VVHRQEGKRAGSKKIVSVHIRYYRDFPRGHKRTDRDLHPHNQNLLRIHHIRLQNHLQKAEADIVVDNYNSKEVVAVVVVVEVVVVEMEEL
jgi:hypothetical protein